MVKRKEVIKMCNQDVKLENNNKKVPPQKPTIVTKNDPRRDYSHTIKPKKDNSVIKNNQE